MTCARFPSGPGMKLHDLPVALKGNGTSVVTMKKTLLCSTLVLVAGSAVAVRAAGRTFEVDGIATEWLVRQPPQENLGLVARDDAGEGEFIWRDLAGDERTDLARPDSELDLIEVRIAGGRSAGATGLAILLRTRTAPGPTAQFQIAIDLDGGLGVGQAWLAGAAETRVADAARWEQLVQTRFGDCTDAVCAARVWHASGPACDDSALASRGEDGVEIFVPWTSLGLQQAPVRALQLTVATCRADAEQRCVDLGGPEVANAIDVVSDGGHPGSTLISSWTELVDQTIDHHLAVSIDPDDNEVYSPLLIDRFSIDRNGRGGGPWIAIFNQNSRELLLEGYQLGDEETAGGDEGMARFPISVIGPLQRVVVAERASDYRTALGERPDFELVNTDPAVPDLLAAPAWAAGAIDLAATGDELLLLDRSNAVVDAVSYGSGRFPGVVPHSPAGRDRLLLRGVVTVDTDSCAADFMARPICATSADCGNPCLTCWDHACLPLPAAIPCSDGNACNGVEMCDGDGRCMAGNPLECDDDNPCTDDGCDPASGCVFARQPQSACSDDEPLPDEAGPLLDGGGTV
jgi:hypothetical protein